MYAKFGCTISTASALTGHDKLKVGEQMDNQAALFASARQSSQLAIEGLREEERRSLNLGQANQVVATERDKEYHRISSRETIIPPPPRWDFADSGDNSWYNPFFDGNVLSTDVLKNTAWGDNIGKWLGHALNFDDGMRDLAREIRDDASCSSWKTYISHDEDQDDGVRASRCFDPLTDADARMWDRPCFKMLRMRNGDRVAAVNPREYDCEGLRKPKAKGDDRRRRHGAYGWSGWSMKGYGCEDGVNSDNAYIFSAEEHFNHTNWNSDDSATILFQLKHGYGAPECCLAEHGVAIAGALRIGKLRFIEQGDVRKAWRWVSTASSNGAGPVGNGDDDSAVRACAAAGTCYWTGDLLQFKTGDPTGGATDSPQPLVQAWVEINTIESDLYAAISTDSISAKCRQLAARTDYLMRKNLASLRAAMIGWTLREATAHSACKACRNDNSCDDSRDTLGGACQPKYSGYANSLVQVLFDNGDADLHNSVGFQLKGQDASSTLYPFLTRRRTDGMNHNIAAADHLAVESHYSSLGFGVLAYLPGVASPGACPADIYAPHGKTHNNLQIGQSSCSIWSEDTNKQRTKCGYFCYSSNRRRRCESGCTRRRAPRIFDFGKYWACSKCRNMGCNTPADSDCGFAFTTACPAEGASSICSPTTAPTAAKRRRRRGRRRRGKL